MVNYHCVYIVIHQYCSVCILFLVPPNGLVIYCGTIVTDEGKEKKVNIDFEPFKPINTSLYLCDNKVGIIGSVSLLR
jgi:peptide subunit release factor 1 (eRF1)